MITHGGQSPPDGTSLLRPEVKREILLVLVELPEVWRCLELMTVRTRAIDLRTVELIRFKQDPKVR